VRLAEKDQAGISALAVRARFDDETALDALLARLA